MTIRVLLVEDQRIVREGLSALLDLVDDVEVVGAAENGVHALDLVADKQPDVVLMDVRMPVMDGVEATRMIRANHPTVAVVVLTTHADDESVFGALRAGAKGYLTKDAGVAEISRAIQLVHAGEALLEPSVQARLLTSLDRAPVVPSSIPRMYLPMASRLVVECGEASRAGDSRLLPGSADHGAPVWSRPVRGCTYRYGLSPVGERRMKNGGKCPRCGANRP